MFENLKFWKAKIRNGNIQNKIAEIKNHDLPSHVAIIMDGNGRWAKNRSLPRIAGHHEGMKVVRKVTKLANEIGVEILTLYAFSTENWKRPKAEVDYIMKLPELFLETYLPELIEENVRVMMIGDEGALPDHTLRAVKKAMVRTEHNDGLILNFALNYGSRTEILKAIEHIVADSKLGLIDTTNLDEKTFANYLMTNRLKDPDLLIRTSGELRLSNFMLWQLAYSEFWFTDVLWPDFKEEHFIEAIEVYQKRQRRFGGV